jgi:hypothetical protein
MQEEGVATPVPITPAQSPAPTSARPPSQSAVSVPVTPTSHATANEDRVPAHKNDVFWKNRSTPTRGGSGAATPRTAAQTPSKSSSSAPTPTLSTPAAFRSVAGQTYCPAESLPDWAAAVALGPRELAEVKQKVHDFERAYFYVKDHVFTSW